MGYSTIDEDGQIKWWFDNNLVDVYKTCIARGASDEVASNIKTLFDKATEQLIKDMIE